MRIALVAAALSLIVAACGSGGSDDGTSTSADPVTSTSADPEGTPSTDSNGPSDATSGLDDVCLAAADEEPFRYWAGMPAEAFDELMEFFHERYPEVEAEYLQIPPEDWTQRIALEVQADREPSADAVRGGLPHFAVLSEMEAIDEDIDWSELGVRDSLVANGTVRIYLAVGGIGYNTDLVSADDLPDTWDEFTDEAWSGERAIFNPEGHNYRSLALEWGLDATVDWLEASMANMEPVIVSGLTPALLSVAGGEVAWTTYARDGEIREQQEAGAPVDIKYLDLVPSQAAYNGVLADAPNRNGAMCFLAWLATDEGEAAFFEVDGKRNLDIPEGAPETSRILLEETDEEIALVNEAHEAVIDVVVDFSG